MRDIQIGLQRRVLLRLIVGLQVGVVTKLEGDEAMAARDVYANRYPDDNSRKMADWEIYSAPIGAVNEEKTKGQLVYYEYTGNDA